MSGGALLHTSLPSSVAKDGMHAVPAASGSTASRGLSWTAAGAVVPAKVKQEPEPAAVIKQEELAVDKGRRRAVATALRHTLYPPDGVDKAAILRSADRTTAFARRTKPRATSGEPSVCGAVVAVAAAEPGADSNTAVVSGSRTLPTGDSETAAAAAARLVAAKGSGKAPADRQGDAGAGDARDGVDGVIHGAGGGFDGADEARAATVGAAGAVADKATGAGAGNVMAEMVARVDLATRTRTRRATRKRTSRALPYRRRRGGRAYMTVPRSQPSRVEVAPLGLLKERS